VLGERIEHVIEKRNVRVDGDGAAVERETQRNLRLFGGAFDGRGA